MSCPLFHQSIRKIWVYKSPDTSGVRAGVIYFLPVGRAQWLRAGRGGTVTESGSILGEGWHIALDNGDEYWLPGYTSAEPYVKTGEVIEKGRLLAHITTSRVALDSTCWREENTSPVRVDGAPCIKTDAISEVLGEEIASFETGKYALLDVQGKINDRTTLVMDGLCGDYAVYDVAAGSSAPQYDPVPFGNWLQYHTWDGWYFDRALTTNKYNEGDPLPLRDVVYLWGKWQVADRVKKIGYIGWDDAKTPPIGNNPKTIAYEYETASNAKKLYVPCELDWDEQDPDYTGRLAYSGCVMRNIDEISEDTEGPAAAGYYLPVNIFSDMTPFYKYSARLILNEDFQSDYTGIFYDYTQTDREKVVQITQGSRTVAGTIDYPSPDKRVTWWRFSVGGDYTSIGLQLKQETKNPGNIIGPSNPVVCGYYAYKKRDGTGDIIPVLCYLYSVGFFGSWGVDFMR